MSGATGIDEHREALYAKIIQEVKSRFVEFKKPVFNCDHPNCGHPISLGYPVAYTVAHRDISGNYNIPGAEALIHQD